MGALDSDSASLGSNPSSPAKVSAGLRAETNKKSRTEGGQMPLKNRHTLIRQPRAPQDNAGDRMFIYAMQCCEFIKVGLSRNPMKRLEEAQLLNPFEIRIVMFRTVSRNDAPTVEKHIHRLLAPWHHDREWFTASLAEIRLATKKAIAEAAKVARADYALLRHMTAAEWEKYRPELERAEATLAALKAADVPLPLPTP